MKEATVEDKKLHCTWSKSGACREGFYIHGYCYTVSQTCDGEWKLYRMSGNGRTFRWLSLYFYDRQAAKVAVSSSQKRPTDSYSSGMIYRGQAKTTNNLVVLLDRLSAFGAYPGELFYLYNQTDNVPSICQMKARGECKFMN